MQLPGRLKNTSLGDLLGSLHRARSNGTLELADGDRTHRVFVHAGQVVAVEVDGSSASLGDVLRSSRAVDDDVLRRSLLRAIASRRLLGDVLVRDFAVAPQVVGAALRRQIAGRLEQLDRLQDARVSFRVALRPPMSALRDAPLGPDEFLNGRPRARDRHDRKQQEMPVSWVDPARAAAFRTLGLECGADSETVRRAYRRLAKSFHPDAHPHASDTQRRDLATRFTELTNAYDLLARAS